MDYFDCQLGLEFGCCLSCLSQALSDGRKFLKFGLTNWKAPTVQEMYINRGEDFPVNLYKEGLSSVECKKDFDERKWTQF